MILTPCGPSAVPTGGAGVALPAGICNFTLPVTFFAIFLYFLDLQEIQLDRCCTAENRHQYTQRVTLRVDLVHFAREVRERPVVDPDVFVLLEAHLRTRTFR